MHSHTHRACRCAHTTLKNSQTAVRTSLATRASTPSPTNNAITVLCLGNPDRLCRPAFQTKPGRLIHPDLRARPLCTSARTHTTDIVGLDTRALHARTHALTRTSGHTIIQDGHCKYIHSGSRQGEAVSDVKPGEPSRTPSLHFPFDHFIKLANHPDSPSAGAAPASCPAPKSPPSTASAGGGSGGPAVDVPVVGADRSRASEVSE